MSANATLALTLSADAAERLSAIAARQNTTPCALAALAVVDLIDRKAAVERGQAEIRAGIGILDEPITRKRQAFLDAERIDHE